ncbi:hypothetical protein CANCADRAFT_125592 [Tortispora caseinolytica NRRL Y-17796]|uniref:BRO domain-containing protein 1 n=1 Tax=Tortispora caseinolytica NRRL Y-17796 TaxID=767744 RepID=A0A1E4T9X6_9ASCO|nr:hypothetical protein CANCADRAFT_125592 [Tortispora caseinolytica NRRL Y-17796]
MPPTPMLALPLKTTEDTDWATPLNRYINSVYGDASQYSESIKTLERMRQDTRGAGLDPTGKDLVYRYYAQLELLELRVPVDEVHCRVSFSWRDSFTKKLVTQHSIAFEKASLLYNLATILTHIAANANTASDFKSAYQNFQAAAGIYTYISDNFLHAPSPDLGSDTVKTLTSLAIAQANEVFAANLVQSNGKPGMIAKVYKAANVSYKAAYLGFQEAAKSNWGDKSWPAYCQVKGHYTAGLAHYYSALNLSATSSKYGVALAHIAQTISHLSTAQKLSLPPQWASLSEIVVSQLKVVKEKEQAMDKENDFIYHCAIPEAASLPEIPVMEAAKPTPLSDLYKGNDVVKLIGKQLFESLIPLSVHEQASKYSEMKATLLRGELEKVELADEQLASALEYLGLPKALYEIKILFQSNNSGADGAEIDSQIREFADNMKACGPPNFNRLETMKTPVFQTIDAIGSALKAEEASSSSFKAKFREFWSQMPSSDAAAPLWKELHDLKQALLDASTSDKRLSADYSAVSGTANILMQGSESSALAVSYRQAQSDAGHPTTSAISLLDLDDTTDSSSEILEAIEQVDVIYQKVNKVKKERAQTYAQLKDKIHKDDISSVLVFNKKVPDVEETLFKYELEKFNVYQKRLEASVQVQTELMKNLSDVWRTILNNADVKRKQSGMQTKQKAVLDLTTKYANAHQVWSSVTAGIEKGIEFYGKLLDQAKRLQSKVDAYVGERNREAQLLSNELERTMGSRGGNQMNIADSFSRFSISSSTDGHFDTPPRLPPKLAGDRGTDPFQAPMLPRQSSYDQPAPPGGFVPQGSYRPSEPYVSNAQAYSGASAPSLPNYQQLQTPYYQTGYPTSDTSPAPGAPPAPARPSDPYAGLREWK